MAFCLGAPALVYLQTFSRVLNRIAASRRKDHLQASMDDAIMHVSDVLVSNGFHSQVTGTTQWLNPHDKVPGIGSEFNSARLERLHDQFMPVEGRVVIMGVGSIDDRPLYMGFTRHGVLSDASVDLYNTCTANGLIKRGAYTIRAGLTPDFIRTCWCPILPASKTSHTVEVTLPKDTELQNAYFFALTKLSIAELGTEGLGKPIHGPQCVCGLLPICNKDFYCRRCYPEQSQPFTGREQLCEHIRGRPHRRKFEFLPSNELLADVEQAIAVVRRSTLTVPAPPPPVSTGTGSSRGRVSWWDRSSAP